jgi:hypothetical protein
VVDAVRCAVEIQRGMAARKRKHLSRQAHRIPDGHQYRRRN